MIKIPRETYKKNKPHIIKWNPPPDHCFLNDGKQYVFVDRKTRRKMKRDYEKGKL